MDDDLKEFKVIPVAETGQLRYRLRFHGSSRQVVFYTKAEAAQLLIDALVIVQQQYKIAKAQLVQKRKPRLRIVKDDDV